MDSQSVHDFQGVTFFQMKGDDRIDGDILIRLLITYLYFKDGIKQSELAILMDMEKAPLSRLLDRMELKGWVERKSESKDRRIKNIYLSEKIKPLINSMRDKAATYRKDSLSILNNQDLNKLRDLLQILKKDLSSKV